MKRTALFSDLLYKNGPKRLYSKAQTPLVQTADFPNRSNSSYRLGSSADGPICQTPSSNTEEFMEEENIASSHPLL